MSEIERAIEHIADNVKFLQTHHNADNSLEAHELALTALKEKLEREKNPLTCEGCLHDGNQNKAYVVCNYCTRKVQMPDRYEPKGDAECITD